MTTRQGSVFELHVHLKQRLISMTCSEYIPHNITAEPTTCSAASIYGFRLTKIGRHLQPPDTLLGLYSTGISHKCIADSSHLTASDCGFPHKIFNTQTCSRYAWYVHVFHLHKIRSIHLNINEMKWTVIPSQTEKIQDFLHVQDIIEKNTGRFKGLRKPISVHL